jgi:uncharacterized membrane protein YkgB
MIPSVRPNATPVASPRVSIPPWPTAAERIDRLITARFAAWAVPTLRVGLGVVFIWFGVLKLIGASPAADLIARTTDWAVDPSWFIPFLGGWEALIGLCLLDPVRLLGGPAWLTRLGILLLALQMPGTFMPLIVVPEQCFQVFPFALTLEGQYIVKNLVLIAGAMVLGATVRGPAGRTTDTGPKIAP